MLADDLLWAWTRRRCDLCFWSRMFLYFNVLPLMVGAGRRDTTTTNSPLFLCLQHEADDLEHEAIKD